MDSGLPSLSQLLESKTGKNETVMSLATSEEMKALLGRVPSQSIKEKDKVDPCLTHTSTSNESNSSVDVVLENMIVKHLSSLGICQTYQAFKDTSLNELLGAINESHQGASEEENVKWGRREFEGGFQATQFNSRPRFEVYQDKQVVAEDIRDFEKLLTGDPTVCSDKISNLLKSMKISKS